MPHRGLSVVQDPRPWVHHPIRPILTAPATRRPNRPNAPGSCAVQPAGLNTEFSWKFPAESSRRHESRLRRSSGSREGAQERTCTLCGAGEMPITGFMPLSSSGQHLAYASGVV